MRGFVNLAYWSFKSLQRLLAQDYLAAKSSRCVSSGRIAVLQMCIVEEMNYFINCHRSAMGEYPSSSKAFLHTWAGQFQIGALAIDGLMHRGLRRL